MATRSRKGCIDCKQAKIKCDEVHPACGTCARRNRQCGGYLDPSISGKITKNSKARATVRAAKPGNVPLLPQPAAQRLGLTGSLLMQLSPQLLTELQTPLPAQLPIQLPLSEASTLSDSTFYAYSPATLPLGSTGDDVLSGASPIATTEQGSPGAVAGTCASPGGHVGADVTVDNAVWLPDDSSNLTDAFGYPLQSPTPGMATDVFGSVLCNLPFEGIDSISGFDGIDDDSNGIEDYIIAGDPGHSQVMSPKATDLQSAWGKSISIMMLRGPSLIPLDGIGAENKPFIEMYFLRHPAEMVINSSFFINEMNGEVLALLQQCPVAVGESLCAIGENYAEEMSGYPPMVMANRRTRLLSRLRLLNEDGSTPEMVLLVLLALCGAELTNPHSDGNGNALTSLIENVAMVLEYHARCGHELSITAKYFAKGVARQDLLHSLSRLRRPKIRPATWLDEYSTTHADRLLGLTATLVPTLWKLAELAEDVHGEGGRRRRGNSDKGSCDNNQYNDDFEVDALGMPMAPNAVVASAEDDFSRSRLEERAADIQAQLLVWRPVHDKQLTMQTSRTLLLHASAWRAAALLYLFRLFSPPGSSVEADEKALGMAYEAMMYINGSPEDVKLSLWPLFVAACELEQPEDRELAMRLFDGICQARPLMTARRTKEFVTENIWAARDRGDVWDWMQLTRRRGPSFMPL